MNAYRLLAVFVAALLLSSAVVFSSAAAADQSGFSKWLSKTTQFLFGVGGAGSASSGSVTGLQVSGPYCTDSDGGQNYVSKGVLNAYQWTPDSPDKCGLKDGTNYIHTPSCSGDACYLIELYCSGTSPQRDFYHCSTGCNDGVCLSVSSSSTDESGGEVALVEVCNDFIDNDYDGLVDEDCIHSACQTMLDKANAALNTKCGDSKYDYIGDVNADGYVNSNDISLVNSKATDANWCSTTYLLAKNTCPTAASNVDMAVWYVTPPTDRNYKVGETVNIAYGAYNNGSSTVDSYTVRLSLGDGNVIEKKGSVLSAGKTESFSTFHSYGKAGTYVVTMTIEAAGDTLLSNNQKTASIVIEPEAVSCTDSDGGNNQYVTGTVVANGKSYADACGSSTNPLGPNNLIEYYCDDKGQLSYAQVTCDRGCRVGACETDDDVIYDEKKVISKNDYFIVKTPTGESEFRYVGATSSLESSPSISLQDTATGNSITLDYKLQYGSVADAFLRYAGGTFGVWNVSPDTSSNFDLRVDLNGDGKIETGVSNENLCVASRVQASISRSSFKRGEWVTITVKSFNSNGLPVASNVGSIVQKWTGKEWQSIGGGGVKTSEKGVWSEPQLLDYEAGSYRTHYYATKADNSACNGGGTAYLYFTVLASGCTETDGGRNYNVKGSANDGSTEYSEYCSADYLTERYCSGSQVMTEQYKCPGGCNDGACIQQNTDMSVWTSKKDYTLNELVEVYTRLPAFMGCEHYYVSSSGKEFKSGSGGCLADGMSFGDRASNIGIGEWKAKVIAWYPEEGGLKPAKTYTLHSNPFFIRETNIPPEITVSELPKTILSGHEYSFNWAATDSNNNDYLSWDIDWGDGSGEMGSCPETIIAKDTATSSTSSGGGGGGGSGGGSGTTPPSSGGGGGGGSGGGSGTTPPSSGGGGSVSTYSASHSWKNPGKYSMKVTVNDCKGGSDSETYSLTVTSDVPPMPEGYTGKINFEPGWNLLSVHFLQHSSSIKEFTCNEKDILAAYLYDPVAKKYVSLISNPDDAAYLMQGKYNDYLVAENLNSLWLKLSKSCSLSYDIDDPYGWIEDAQNKGKHLAKGWNFLGVVPDMVGYKLGDFAGTCKTGSAYSWASFSKSWQDVSSVEFSSNAVGYGFIVKVSDDCLLSQSAKPAEPPPPLPDSFSN